MEAAYGHEQSAERDTGLRSCLSLLQALHGMLATVTQQADALVGGEGGDELGSGAEKIGGGGEARFRSWVKGLGRDRVCSGADKRDYTRMQ